MSLFNTGPVLSENAADQRLHGLAGGILPTRWGVVARFNAGARGAAFSPLCSRHHSVGLRPGELGHPVEDVTPDHGLFRLRDAVPRLQTASKH